LKSNENELTLNVIGKNQTHIQLTGIMKATGTLLIALLFSFIIKAQTPIEGGYIQLSYDEYTELIEVNKENELHGKYYVREFNDDKKLIGIHKIEYIKGKKTGEWLHFLVFRKKGVIDLSTIENYENGLRNGYYYNSDNGFTFSEEGRYEKGKKEGLWYVTKGGSKEKINYKNGKKHGDYWRQDASGVIVKGAYKKGEKLDNWVIEDLSGNTKSMDDNSESVIADGSNTSVQTIEGIIHKPDGTIAPIAVVRLQLSDTSCAYAFSDFEGKFAIEIDKSHVTPDSYFEIVIEGFPKKVVSFSAFTNKSAITLEKGRKKISYDEYRSYYQSMKDCQ